MIPYSLTREFTHTYLQRLGCLKSTGLKGRLPGWKLLKLELSVPLYLFVYLFSCCILYRLKAITIDFMKSVIWKKYTNNNEWRRKRRLNWFNSAGIDLRRSHFLPVINVRGSNLIKSYQRLIFLGYDASVCDIADETSGCSLASQAFFWRFINIICQQWLRHWKFSWKCFSFRLGNANTRPHNRVSSQTHCLEIRNLRHIFVWGITSCLFNFHLASF